MTDLTPEQIADGWKPHDGGPCPVALDADVWLLHHGGHISHTYVPAWWSEEWGRWAWKGVRDGWIDNIIAYKEEPKP